MSHRSPNRTSPRFDATLRHAGIPALNYPPNLPVVERRAEIAKAIQENPVVVICGETGSGKTTQLPKICLEVGRGLNGFIGHTQPRRIAARTVAARIAEELHQPLGNAVGFKIRFTDVTRPDTYIKLMTDGILLAETQHDRDLRQYDTIIIDEAHERSLNVDFLLGYLKRLLPRRPDLKLIITSATIDPTRFSKHFDGAPVINVSGRTYPVSVLYRPLSIDERSVEDDREQVGRDDADLTEIEGVVGAVRELWSSSSLSFRARAEVSGLADAESVDQQTRVAADHAQSKQLDVAEPPHPNPHPEGEGTKPVAPTGRGDTLVFLPTERDIRECAEALEHANLNADILPLFSRLSSAEQMRVFHPDGKRARIVLATNVAETSVTVPGIRYVIDTGLARMSRYSTRTKVQRLPIEPISQASADQRKGRCGRVSAGVCVRLYSEKDFLERPQFTDPEILRTNLASVILQMMWLRLGKVEQFPFLDPPDYRQIRDGLATLHELGAIDDKENLTEIGRRLAKLPVDPRVGRMIVGGQDEHCIDEILVIAAALSVSDVRERPSDASDAADQAHAKFRDEQSDFISLLKLWRALKHEQAELSNNQFRKWCRANFISYMRYREWTDIHHQLCDMLQVKPWRDHAGAIRPSVAMRAQDHAEPFPPTLRDKVHRALLPGLLANFAMKADAASYTGARGTKMSIWPGSALFKSRPAWIMGAELVETTRLYTRTVAPVRLEWIERAAKHLTKSTYQEPHWHAQTAHVLAFEKVTLFGLLLVPRRSVHYGPVDPFTSRQLFIHHALVNNEFRTDHPAMLRNRRLIAQVEAWQNKLRRRDLLTEGGVRYAFFDARVPEHVFSGPTFDDWTRRGRDSNSHQMELTDHELIRADAAIDLWKQFARTPLTKPRPTTEELRPLVEQAFPDALQLDGTRLPLQYAFEPGDDTDGVTAIVPVTALSQIPDARVEWLVPGLVRDKVEALIRSLPKKLRTQFVPANETAQKVMEKLPPFGIGSLIDQVAGILWKIGGEPVTRADFQLDTLAPYLSLQFRVIGAKDDVVAESRDLPSLRIKLGQKVRQAFSSLNDPRYTRDDVKQWDFGDLPERVPVEHAGAMLYGFPTLIEQGEQVILRLLDSPEAQAAFMPAGLRRLFMIQTAREIKSTLRDLPNLERLRLNYRPFGTGDELMSDLTFVLAYRSFFIPEEIVRTQAEFIRHAGEAWGRMYEVSRSLGALLTDVLERFNALFPVLSRTYPPLLLDSIEDMRLQLKMLLPKRFATAIPPAKLEHLPRYLRGIDIRLTRLTNAGLAKDLQGLGVIRPPMQQYLDLARKQNQRGILDPALQEYRWMLEEFRLQLFAQEVKTVVPVSEKRLEQLWSQVKRV